MHLACFALAFQSGADYDSVPIPYFHREVIVLRLISEIFQYVQAQGDLRQGEVRRGRLLSVPLPRAAADTLVSAELWCTPYPVSFAPTCRTHHRT